jgi:chitinase
MNRRSHSSLVIMPLITGWAWLSICGVPLQLLAQPAAPRFRVAGYLPDYRLASFDQSTAASLTDLILFSAELTSDGDLDMSRLKQCPWEKLRELQTRHHVRVQLAIGGWDRSAHFAAVTASSEKRAKCIASIRRILQQHQLDGVDFDWEHPRNAVEEQGYATLLQEVRQALGPHRHTLTVTMASWQRLPASGIASVDGVQVMAYDHDQRHSTFEGSRRDVQKLIDAGIPSAKVILGLPFYGRQVTTREAMTYRDIRVKWSPASDTDEVEQFYFNGPATIRRKVEYAIDSRLGGVMVWEVGQDAPGPESLLKVIQDTVQRHSTAR